MKNTSGFLPSSKMKKEIMRLLLSNDKICRAVYNNKEECLIDPVPNPGTTLPYNNIFPYRHSSSNLEEDKKTYITLDINITKRLSRDGKNSDFFDYDIVVYVFTHKDLMKIKIGNEYEIRTDFLLDQIDETLRKNKFSFGMDQLHLDQSGSMFLTVNYPCFFSHYSTYDYTAPSTDMGGYRDKLIEEKELNE